MSADEPAGLIVRVDVCAIEGRALSDRPHRGRVVLRLEGAEQADDGPRIRKRRTDQVLVAQTGADDIGHRRVVLDSAAHGSGGLASS